MLILDKARLVVLEMPKTATQALRKALAPHVRELNNERRHGGFRAFKRHLYPTLTGEWGGNAECCCVVREPLARAQSWYRYRQRDNMTRTENSTAEIGFDTFIEAMISDSPPPFAKTGRQAQFTKWNGVEAMIDHVFDYQNLDLFLTFLGDRLGTQLKLPQRNQSTAPMPEPLSPQLQARFAAEYSRDYALYQAVLSAGGHLQRGALSGSQTGAA
jgi:hypothetical protein